MEICVVLLSDNSMKVATLPTNRFDKMVGSCTQDLAMYLQKDNLESISIKRTICIYGSIEYISDMARVKKMLSYIR